MTDEERAAANKAAVDAMRNAKANMGTVLERVANLESALSSAARAMGTLKNYISPNAYIFFQSGSPQKKCIDIADEAIAAINKVL